MATSVFKWLSVSFMISVLNVTPANFQSNAGSAVPGTEGRHPFHVSTTEINHNAKDKTLEVTCRIFTDDFEAILEKNYKTKVDLTHPAAAEKATIDKIVSDYIKKHLQLKADGKQVTLSYLGYEIDNDAAAVYLEVDNIPSVKKVETTDSILYDQFDDQIRIIHVIVGGNRKSDKLDYPDTQAVFQF
jgi:hypothetical protein